MLDFRSGTQTKILYMTIQWTFLPRLVQWFKVRGYFILLILVKSLIINVKTFFYHIMLHWVHLAMNRVWTHNFNGDRHWLSGFSDSNHNNITDQSQIDIPDGTSRHLVLTLCRESEIIPYCIQLLVSSLRVRLFVSQPLKTCHFYVEGGSVPYIKKISYKIKIVMGVVPV
jgi:hypothetical protein